MLKEHDPTLQLPGVRTASELAAQIAAQIAVQPQSVQRSMAALEDHLTELATDFVANVVETAQGSLDHGIRRFQAAAPSEPDGLQLPDDWAGPVAGPTLIEKHFGINRSTLHRWHKRGECIALNARTSKKPVFPLRQFLDGRPVDGLAEVIAIFKDQRDAWQWLVARNVALGGNAPIDLLIQGEQQPVIEMARRSKA
ncbi:antitoxin Xre/MbcA/ParS-like domain-containing protein [Aquamicrobium terrae]|uniref:Antitoxin Xre/MbcA/ParS-like middle domain-containing protein n=1 Tax=Aquamicrobium terrae TaxID=1324945 RepID=A0ABV2MY61_9HYPH